jgi:hypothetical protein
VEAGRALTVPAGGFATLPVTLTVVAAALRHTRDGAPGPVGGQQGSWLSEASGTLLLAPHDGGPVLRVPLYAAPQPVGLLAATPAAFDAGAAVSATLAVTLTGAPLAGTAQVTAGAPPTQPVALAGLFALHTRSPALAEPPAGAPAGLAFAQADVRAVGMAGPLAVGGGPPMLYFVVQSYAPWSTPHEVTFFVYFDTDDDGAADLRLGNSDALSLLDDEAESDRFVSVLEKLPGGRRTLQGDLNGYPAATLDPRLYNSDVMVLPVQVAELGLARPTRHFRYYVESYSEDISNARPLKLVVDRTPWRSVNLAAQSIELAAPGGLPLAQVMPGERLTLRFLRGGDARPGRTALLAVYPTNPTGHRVQIIPIASNLPYPAYLPWVTEVGRD